MCFRMRNHIIKGVEMYKIKMLSGDCKTEVRVILFLF